MCAQLINAVLPFEPLKGLNGHSVVMLDPTKQNKGPLRVIHQSMYSLLC